jgi:hypothetical protein
MNAFDEMIARLRRIADNGSVIKGKHCFLAFLLVMMPRVVLLREP